MMAGRHERWLALSSAPATQLQILLRVFGRLSRAASAFFAHGGIHHSLFCVTTHMTVPDRSLHLGTSHFNNRDIPRIARSLRNKKLGQYLEIIMANMKTTWERNRCLNLQPMALMAARKANAYEHLNSIWPSSQA